MSQINNLFISQTTFSLLSYIIYLLFISEMRNFFDLQKAEFSDSSDEEAQVFSKQALNIYNQEYSLLLSQTKKFFGQCKDCISRLMALNNMGFGFNLPFILTTLIAIQNNSCSQKNKNSQQLQQPNENKQKYFKIFYDVLFRMSKVIEDLQDLQLQIKKNYFRINFPQPIQKKRQGNFFDKKGSNKSRQSSNHEFIRNIKKSIIEQQEVNYVQNQHKIRDVLKKNMTYNSLTSSNPICVKEEPLANLQKLGQKINAIEKKMKDQRQKQQKIWENFKNNIVKAQRQKFGKQKKIDRYQMKSQQDGDLSANTKNSVRKDSSTFFY